MANTIFGSLRSPFVLTVALALYEKGQEFELVVSDYKSAEYKATLNPLGKVPSFKDQDITLFESKAITRYIANKYEGQGTPLLGSTPQEAALVEQWLEVHSHHFLVPMHVLGAELRKKATDPNFEYTSVDAALATYGKVLDVYEARLSESKYLAGDHYTLADLVHIPMFFVLTVMIDDERRKVVTSRPHVNAWFEDMSSRPAWKKVLERPDAAHFGQHKHGH
ncbi:hypothetical protein Mapa_002490 [Marchantia paleacea]|nr:hypothetical protein Mapa_002490 [Marchantia paleacea]